MELFVKKTTELSGEEIDLLNALDDEIYHHGNDRETFLRRNLNTVTGYSYHAFLVEDGRAVGMHTGIPFYYQKDGEKFLAGLGIDSMILKPFRDYFNFRDVFMGVENEMAKDGCKLRIGFPNDNSYPILKKGFKYKDVGCMDTYFLPIKVGAVKPKLKCLNFLSELFCGCMVGLSALSTDKKQFVPKYGKDHETFDEVRYKWASVGTECIDVKGIKVYYMISDYEGVRTAFIMDAYPLSKSAFDQAVRIIYKKCRHSIDMIMYVGVLPFTPASLIRMPHKFEPKHFRFTCKVLDKEFFDDTVYDINNWDVNLASYDLL